MAKRNDLNTSAAERDDAAGATTQSKEQRLVAFAEQLGWLAGTIQGKAEGWLNNETLTAQISKVRDGASALLEQLRPAQTAGSARPSGGNASSDGGGAKAKPETRAKGADTSEDAGNTRISLKGKVASKVRASATSGRVSAKSGSKGRSGGAVDAPGKKHRKPMPSESGATGSPRGQGSRIAKLKARNQNRVQRRG
jgi:hypothetical protein